MPSSQGCWLFSLQPPHWWQSHSSPLCNGHWKVLLSPMTRSRHAPFAWETGSSLRARMRRLHVCEFTSTSGSGIHPWVNLVWDEFFWTQQKFSRFCALSLAVAGWTVKLNHPTQKPVGKQPGLWNPNLSAWSVFGLLVWILVRAPNSDVVVAELITCWISISKSPISMLKHSVFQHVLLMCLSKKIDPFSSRPAHACPLIQSPASVAGSHIEWPSCVRHELNAPSVRSNTWKTSCFHWLASTQGYFHY